MAKRFTNEEIELLSKSPYVKNIRQNRLTFTYEFRCILYDEWIKQPSTSQIRSVLKSYGFDCSMLGKDVIKKSTVPLSAMVIRLTGKTRYLESMILLKSMTMNL